MKPEFASALYDLAWRLALPAVFARLWWRGHREPPYRSGWAQRLGHWPETAGRVVPRPDGDAPLVWLHAVSLGETRAAAPLISALRDRHPGLRLLLTTGTATGWTAGLPLLAPGDLHGWIPLDTPGAPRRFLSRFRPDLGILMETETWPNLLRQAERLGVPVVLANARLSERSLAKGQRSAWLTAPMMRRLSAVFAQTDDDAQRFVAAGVPQERVQVTGQLKYDLHPPENQLARGRMWRAALQAQAPGRRVVLAASWREGEDEPLLEAWQRHMASGSPDQPLLLLVPRHPQRFDAVAAAVRRQGLSLVRRAEWGDLGDEPDRPQPSDSIRAQQARADVWLGDSLGEMVAYGAMADVALLGGSFAPLGGQNLIEVAAAGCPVILGPHTFNFEEAARWALDEGAAWREPDLTAAVGRAKAADAADLEAASARALAFAQRHAGAARRMAQALSAWLSRSKPAPGAP